MLLPRTLRRILQFLKPVRRYALISAVILVARILIEVACVYMLSPLITNLSQTLTVAEPRALADWLVSEEASAVRIRSVLLWMFSAQVIMATFIFLRSTCDMRMSMAAVRHVRSLMYDHLQHLTFSHSDRITHARLINRALRDIDTVHGFIQTGFLLGLEILVSIVAYLGLLFIRSPYLVVAALFVLPIWYILITRFSRKAQPLYGQQHRAWDGVMTAVTENIAGQHVIKAFGTQNHEIQKYTLVADNFLQRLYAVIRFQATFSPTMRMVAILAHISIFVVCAFLIQQGHLVVGDLMILGAAMAAILSKLEQVNHISESYQRAVGSAERVFEILDSRMTETAGHAHLPEAAASVRFENVTFGYSAERAVLKKLTCEIPANSVTALVGPTGAGKSTMSMLIARFYDPLEGQITLDGKSIADFQLRDLRQYVGFVFQETFLFTDSIRNNIRYGRTDVSEEMLVAAARIAHADEFIRQLPQGYDTPLGENGVQLSGGQRQRLALARALVYDPKVLILDDATAALDPSTESQIQMRLAEAFAGRTVLLITHKISSLQFAEQILVLQNGVISQQGTHSDLMRVPGHYRQLIHEMHDMEDSDHFSETLLPERGA